RAKLEPALRPLLLLRPRPADPVRDLSDQRAEGDRLRRRAPRPPRRWRRAQAADVSRRVRRIRDRRRGTGGAGAQGPALRPRVPPGCGVMTGVVAALNIASIG